MCRHDIFAFEGLQTCIGNQASENELWQRKTLCHSLVSRNLYFNSYIYTFHLYLSIPEWSCSQLLNVLRVEVRGYRILWNITIIKTYHSVPFQHDLEQESLINITIYYIYIYQKQTFRMAENTLARTFLKLITSWWSSLWCATSLIRPSSDSSNSNLNSKLSVTSWIENCHLPLTNFANFHEISDNL